MSNQFKDFLPDTPPKERLELLRSNCDKQEYMTYTRDLTEEEELDMRAKFSENYIAIAQLDEELDTIKAGFKGKTKVFKAESALAISCIRSKTIEIKGDVFLFADYDNKVMVSHDETGMVIGTRRLKKEEYQTSMHAVIRKVANQ